MHLDKPLVHHQPNSDTDKDEDMTVATQQGNSTNEATTNHPTVPTHEHADDVWAADAAARIMSRCDELALLSDMDDGIERTYLSEEMKRAYELTGDWMREAGMTVHIDQAGNLVGDIEGSEPGLPALVLGSHLDSVRDAGKYDGILGVITAIEVVRHLRDVGLISQLPFSLKVVGFGDEEGTRFGATLLGSYALAGKWNEDWLDLTDSRGTTMRQAFTDFGLDPNEVSSAALALDDAFGYLEFHIEQGPILEQRDRALSSVSSIAAASRYQVCVHGESRHIATPYDLRQDALTAAAEMIAAVDRISQSLGARANVGEIVAKPGGVNVIAGQATFSLDVRAGLDEQRDEVFAQIWRAFDDIAATRKVSVTKECMHTAHAVVCDPALRSCIEAGVEEAEHKAPFGLISFPGHDGMAVAELLPIAMLYVRCKGGISHNPAESVTVEDVAYGVNAFEQAVLAVARLRQQQDDEQDVAGGQDSSTEQKRQ